jgi:hypothetical protein
MILRWLFCRSCSWLLLHWRLPGLVFPRKLRRRIVIPASKFFQN